MGKHKRFTYDGQEESSEVIATQTNGNRSKKKRNKKRKISTNNESSIVADPICTTLASEEDLSIDSDRHETEEIQHFVSRKKYSTPIVEESEGGGSSDEDEAEIEQPDESEDLADGDFQRFDKNEMCELLERVKNELPSKMTHRYTRSLKHFDWSKVEFGNYTAEDCRRNYEGAIRQVRKHRTLIEITEDCMKLVSRMNSRYKAFRCNLPPPPKAPPTSFIIFAGEYRKKLLDKNPSLEMIEAAKLTGEKWRNLSEKKKSKYVEQYNKLRAEYNTAMEKYRFDHPEAFAKARKTKESRKQTVLLEKGDYKSPFLIYLESKLSKHENVTSDSERKKLENEYREKWDALSDKRKYKFIEQSIKKEGEYRQRLIDKYSEDSSKVKNFRSIIKKSERDLFERMNGKPEKPPSSGFFLFMNEYRGEDDVEATSSKERVQVCKNMYRLLTEEQKQQYTLRAKELNDQYLIEVQEYCKKLSDRDMMNFLMKNTNSVNKKFLLNKLLTKENGDGKLSVFDVPSEQDID